MKLLGLVRPTLLLSLLLAAASAASPSLAASGGPSATGNQILVVLDQPQSEYSLFFDQLRSRGYKLAFKGPKALKPQLVEHDVKAYDHLILLTPAAKSLANDLSAQSLVNYLKDGGNVLFGLDSDVSELFRDLAREFSVELEERGSALVDHYGYDPRLDAGNHTTLLVGPGRAAHLPQQIDLPAGGIVENAAVFSPGTLQLAQSHPILYRGIAHRLGSNPLAFPLLVAPATAYSTEVPELIPADEKPKSTTSYSQPAPITTTATRVVDGEQETYETVVTPSPVPTVVQVASPKGTGKRDWTAKGRASLEPLDQRAELVAGLSRSAGDTVSLVSAFQLKDNSARVLFVGSTAMLKDAFFRPQPPSLPAEGGGGYETLNARVAEDLTSWVFQERSVLRVQATHHQRVKSSETDRREDYEETAEGNRMYRIKDHVTYRLELAAFSSGVGWVPAPVDLPLQVTFKMLDPYITTDLVAPAAQNATRLDGLAPPDEASSAATTRYAATFQIPDRHGVFTFLVDFKRHGWSFVHARDTAPVRPFNHDEYPRFLSASWPYVAGAVSTAVGFVLFTWLWLTLKDGEEEGQRRAGLQKKAPAGTRGRMEDS